MRRTLKARTALILGAVSMAMLLLVGAACARAVEPTATPRPAAAVAPGVPTAIPAPATATLAPAKVGLTEWVVGMAEDPSVKVTQLVPGGAVGPGIAQTLVHETLLVADGYDLRLKSRAAESWEFTDNLTLVYKLRKGIKGHKAGTELTSADVKYTLDTIRSDPRLAASAAGLKFVQDITTPDPYTVKITFTTTDPTFPVVNRPGNIIPKERKGNEDAYDTKDWWSYGWYKIVDWTKDKPVKVEAFKDHYMGVADPPKVTFVWMREASTRTAALLAGEAHIIAAVPIVQASVIRGRQDLAVARIPNSRSIFWQLNTNPKHPYFSNLKVRQALNYAMNKELVVNDILGGNATVIGTPLIRGWLGYEESKDIKPYPYDPVKAVQLLREAGFDRGFAFDFMASSGVFQKDQEIAEAYASMWEAIGLKPRIRITDRGTAFDIVREGDKWDTAGTFQWGPSIEPDGYINWIAGTYSKNIRETPDLDSMRDLQVKARTTLDIKERSKLYGELSRRMYDYALLPFSHTQDELYGVNKATKWVPMVRTLYPEVYYNNYPKLAGYGPNYEKWDDSLATNYWNK